MRTVVLGSIVIIAMLWVLLTSSQSRAPKPRGIKIFSPAVFVVVFGFLFVTVAGRISGLLGNSSNPISGMSIATLMATCAIFFSPAGRPPSMPSSPLMIGGAVCIAAAIAGATSQDLKNRLPGRSTPFWQQMGLLVGVRYPPWPSLSLSSS